MSVGFNPRLFHLPKKDGAEGEVEGQLTAVFALGSQDKRISSEWLAWKLVAEPALWRHGMLCVLLYRCAVGSPNAALPNLTPPLLACSLDRFQPRAADGGQALLPQPGHRPGLDARWLLTAGCLQ